MKYFVIILIFTFYTCTKDDDSKTIEPEIFNVIIESEESEQPNDAVFLPSGHIGTVVTSKHIGVKFIELNAELGSAISSKVILNQPSLFARDLFVSNTKKYLLADFELTQDLRNVKLINLNPNFSFKSEQVISSIHHEVGVKILEQDNEEKVLLVNRKHKNTDTWGFVIYELSDNGVQNVYEYPHAILQSASDMIKKQDGSGYYVFAHAIENLEHSTDYVLFEFDNNFQLIRKKYFGGNEYEEARQILEDDSGNLYLFGHSASKDILHEMYLIKLNSNLETVYEKHFGSPYHDGGQTLCFDGSNKLTLIGRTNAPSNTNEGIYYLKVSTNGSVIHQEFLGNTYSNRSNIVMNKDGVDYIVGYTEIDNNFTKNIDYYRIRYN